MSNTTKGPFMQAMEKYTKSIKTFISAQGFGHYSKPSGGIPKSDLEQSVQTSLGKADTALQTFTESDPTVPAWAKASTKPSYTPSEVGLGKVGNFKAVSTEASQGLSDTEKVNARTNIGAGTGNGTYSKPSGGIPKSDLASAVQTSLGKADSALQSETDPTVPSWAKASTKPSYTQDEVGDGTTYKRVSATEKTTWNNKGTYSKPSGGIPKTDLASAVQTSLGKADSALQSETDPTVPAWAKAASKPSYTASEVGLGNVGNFKAVSTVASQGLSDTEKANARTNIGAGTSSFSGSYNDLSNKPTIPTKTSQLTNDSGYTANTGTVTGVKVGSTSYSPSSGVVSLPAYPTTLPASDVSSWAKASSKPSYTASEVGLGNVGNFKAVSTVASQGLSDTEKSNARANIGAGTGNGTYSKPSGGIPKTDLASAVQTSLGKADTALQSETDPTVPAWAKASSKPSYTASEVGLGNVGNFKAVSTVASQGLSNTEKANARANIGAGTSSFSGSYNDLSNKPSSLPASDVYPWAKASSKPSYTYSEVGAAASSHTHNYAGSSSAGGAATSANKLNTNAGSATQPVYFSNGVPVATTYTLGKSVPSDAKFTDTTYSAATTSAAGLMSATDKSKLDIASDKLKIKSTRAKCLLKTWTTKTWSGLTIINPDHIWTDGTNIYYSEGTSHFVLNGSTWSAKTWYGLTDFNGYNIWTDGDNIYCSDNAPIIPGGGYKNIQYVLNKSTSTWSTKTWSGLTSFQAADIWTDGTDIYRGSGYVLNKSTSTWSTKTWSGLTSFQAPYIWTDGYSIYYSKGTSSTQYVLNGSTWSAKTWSGFTTVDGRFVWTDGTDTYYSRGTDQYVLNGSTWIPKTWGDVVIGGTDVWTDGANIYSSSGTSNNYVLTTDKIPVRH